MHKCFKEFGSLKTTIEKREKRKKKVKDGIRLSYNAFTTIVDSTAVTLSDHNITISTHK